MPFENVYDDAQRAEAYATLDFPGTYFLAFRDLPRIIGNHVAGSKALDFGCGAGRSTRFLKGLGFQATGIDISESMVRMAHKLDPAGRYEVVPDGDFRLLAAERFDLVFSAFAFDNIPGPPHRAQLLQSLRDLLTPHGRIILLGSTPEIYTHEWASFTTKQFPENRSARSGETVRIVMRDVEDARPVVDLVWFHEDYLRLFEAAGLRLLQTHRPLGLPHEPHHWVNEEAVGPWVIYVLGKE